MDMNKLQLLLDLQEQKKKIAEEEARIKKEIAPLQEQVINMFVEDGVSSIKFNGKLIFMAKNFRPEVPDKPALARPS